MASQCSATIRSGEIVVVNPEIVDAGHRLPRREVAIRLERYREIIQRL
jgi:hypothetical protein